MFSFFKYRKQYKDWQMEHDANAPKVGDIAPDFSLSDANGQNPINPILFSRTKACSADIRQLYLTAIYQGDGASPRSL